MLSQGLYRLGRVSARRPWVVIGAFVATQVFFVVYDIQDGTAWWAHLGGFAAGVVLVALFKRSDQPLFGGAPDR